MTNAFFKDLHNDAFWRNDSIISADIYLTPEDLSGVATNPKVVLFDACYNGSFQDDDYLAAYYLLIGAIQSLLKAIPVTFCKTDGPLSS